VLAGLEARLDLGRIQRAGRRDVHADDASAVGRRAMQIELQAPEVDEPAAPDHRGPGDLVQAQATMAARAVDAHLLAEVGQDVPGLRIGEQALGVPGAHRVRGGRVREDRDEPLTGGDLLLEGVVLLGEVRERRDGRLETGRRAQQVRGAGDRGEHLGRREGAGDEGREVLVVLSGDAQALEQGRPGRPL
jgi:hypothetical protein